MFLIFNLANFHGHVRTSDLQKCRHFFVHICAHCWPHVQHVQSWLEDPYHKCQTRRATWLWARRTCSLHVIAQCVTHLTLALRMFVRNFVCVFFSVASGLRRGGCGDASRKPVCFVSLFGRDVWAQDFTDNNHNQ